MSPELETLDQLLGGDLPLHIVRGLYPDDAGFARGLLALLATGEVRLVDAGGAEVPRWQWRQVLADPDTSPGIQVNLTPAGGRRIA